MHKSVRVSIEGPRKCGYRKAGGLYLVGPELSAKCGKLPLALSVCPCCGEGIRPSRSPRMLKNPGRLFADVMCLRSDCRGETVCPLSDARLPEMGAGLVIWIGNRFYPSPSDFTSEAERMGVSRRIQAVPHSFEVGKTWVLLAHRRAVMQAEFGEKPTPGPGIFSVFKPTAIEVIVTEEQAMDEEYIEGLLARGLSPVLVKRAFSEQAIQAELILPESA